MGQMNESTLHTHKDNELEQAVAPMASVLPTPHTLLPGVQLRPFGHPLGGSRASPLATAAYTLDEALPAQRNGWVIHFTGHFVGGRAGRAHAGRRHKGA